MRVVNRKTTARPDINSGRSGRASFTSNATMAGSARPHAIHIAPSRAIAASVLSLSGKDFAAAS